MYCVVVEVRVSEIILSRIFRSVSIPPAAAAAHAQADRDPCNVVRRQTARRRVSLLRLFSGTQRHHVKHGLTSYST